MKNHKKGFTIVELIFVISCIIAIVSFLTPKFVGYINKVNRFKAITIANQIQNAIVSATPDEINTNDKIRDILSDFTNVNIGTIEENLVDTDNIINIMYTCNMNTYNVNIDIDNSGYQVKSGKIELFRTDTFPSPTTSE